MIPTPRAVVVAHRDRMVAEGIASALGSFPWLMPSAATTMGEVRALAETVHAAALDPDLDGSDRGARQLRRRGVRVVFLGDHGGEEENVRVRMSAPVVDLASALMPEVSPPRPRPGRLTARERDVLSLVARGLAAKQVARHLGISAKTVERHKTNIFLKLGVPNQAAAVGIALASRDIARTGPWI